MSQPWWRSLRGLDPLIEAGERRGWVTMGQLSEVLLPDTDPDVIEDVIQALSERGINVVEGDNTSDTA